MLGESSGGFSQIPDTPLDLSTWQPMSSASSSWNPQPQLQESTYYGEEPESSDSSSDASATSSDDGAPMSDPGIADMDDHQAAEYMFLKFRKARRQWRRFTGRPVRRFRRKVKKHYKKRHYWSKGGKGKGHGHGVRHRNHGKGGAFMLTQTEII